jgi:hypothetical protein
LSARDEAAASLAMTGDFFLGRVEGIGSPMTIGVWRHRVLLPAVADAWSPERLRAVLIHELGHVRRRDTLIQLIAQLASVVYWWNPLAWLAAARLRIERELACDDLVLGAGIRPSSYAADLLEVARSRSGAVQAGAVPMADGSCTEGRLRRILDPATPRRPPGAWFRLAARGGTVALAMTLACASGPPPAAAAVATGKVAESRLWLASPRFSTEVPLLLAADSLDASLIAAEVQRHAGALEACYARRLRVHPELSGTVTVSWTLIPGMVFDHGVLMDTLHDAEVRSCVEDLVQEVRFRFPASPDGRQEIVLPLFFGQKPPPQDEGC